MARKSCAARNLTVNRNLLASELAELADRVQRIRPLGALSLAELSANRDAFDLASFNLGGLCLWARGPTVRRHG